ncbi:MAG: ABC transporter permease [Bacteroidales bacterium]|nr:ABC transporter permease [Bacteroidales bacterium]
MSYRNPSPPAMWSNYLRSALRNLIRYKGFSLINILGLSIGMACSILIFLWVQYELSWDKFNSKSDHLYRLVQTQYYSTGPLTTACMPGPISDDIRNEVPGIVNSFMFYWYSMFCSYEDKILEETVCLADPQIFEMLDFNFIRGDSLHVFGDMLSIVITDEMARKYFGDADPMGKVLTLNREHHFKVTGVIEKPPPNSSFPISCCIPFKYVENLGMTIDRYGWNSYYVYVQLHDEAKVEEVNARIRDFIINKQENREERKGTVVLFLFPFEKMHLYSYRGDSGDIQYIYIFSGVGLFILLIACINFMNLSTARSSRRSREIGIRKTVGANRKQIMQQFMSESVLMTFIAFVLALIIVFAVLPGMNVFLETELSMNLLNPVTASALILILVFVGLFAGSYPAMYLSRFQPVGVLKEQMVKGRGGKYFRRTLVIFQFALSIILIICTMVIFNQMGYIQNKDLGLDRENVVYQYMRGSSEDKYESIKAELLQYPGITAVSRGRDLPFRMGSNSGGFDWEGSEGNNDVLIGFTTVDFNWDQVMGIKLSDGRFYDKRFATDTTRIVINEKLAGFISGEGAVGKWLTWGEGKREIIGVVRDFNHLPVKHEIDPLVMVLDPESGGYLFVRFNPQNREESIAHFRQVWEKFNPDYPFDLKYLDQTYDEVYRDEEKLMKIFRIFTLLSIFISCLGLFGMAAYMAEQRTREISIRKVFGASTSVLAFIMTRDFLRWIIIANLLAWPIAWYAMKRWLENYVYHTDLSARFFIFGALASIIISLATVIMHALRTARKNPAVVLGAE